MNIVITPETSDEWSRVMANNLQVGTVIANSGVYMFHPSDIYHEEFSLLELAEIRYVGNEAATVLTVTKRLKGNS